MERPAEPRRWSDLSRPPLSESSLRAALTTGADPAWRALEVVPTTGSTNADLAARARAGEPEGLVLVADEQTAGRGRLGRSWQAPARSALAVSVLLAPGREPDPVDPADWTWLPLIAGLAVVDALSRTCGLPARLKWPNDVLVPDGGLTTGELRKVCGILGEVVPGPDGPVAVVGAGINVSQVTDELPVPTATSLRLAGSSTLDRDTVLRAYLRALAARYRTWRQHGGKARSSGLAAAYREACATIGLEVTVELPGGVVHAGVAQGVDDDGRLLLAGQSGAVTALAAGDVVHLRGST